MNENGNVFYSLREKKQPQQRVPWETVLGSYRPDKTYYDYKKVYNAKMLAAKNEISRRQLKAAWKNLRHDFSGSKVQYNQKLQHLRSQGKLTTDTKAKIRAQYDARRGFGRVALPAIVRKGDVQKQLREMYVLAEKSAARFGRMSLTRMMQKQFYDQLAAHAPKTASRTILKTAMTTALGSVIALPTISAPIKGVQYASDAACLAVKLPYIDMTPSQAIRYLKGQVAEYALDTPGGKQVQAWLADAMTPNRVKKVVEYTLPAAAKLLGLLNSVNCNIFPQLLERYVPDFANEQLRKYGLTIKPSQLSAYLAKHAKTVQMFLMGEDVTFEKMVVDLVNFVDPSQLTALLHAATNTVAVVQPKPKPPPPKQPNLVGLFNQFYTK